MKTKIRILCVSGAVFAAITAVLAVTALLPLPVILLAATVSDGCFVFAAVLSKKKTRAAVRVIIVTVFLAVAILIMYACNPYAGSTIILPGKDTLEAGAYVSQSRARADIREAYHYLKKVHPLFLKNTPEATETAYLQALADIPAQGISCAELWRRIESFCSTLGDAHTFVSASPKTERYPCDYAEMIKGKGLSLTEVNGQPLDAFLKDNLELFSYEHESWAMEKLCGYLITDVGLAYLGLGTEVTLTYESPTEHVERTYSDSDFLSYDAYMERNGQYYNQNKDFVRFELYPEEDYALLTLDSCDYNERYCSVLQDLFSQVSEQNIGRIIVDLRKNTGGNDMVAWEFISYLGVESFQTVAFEQRNGFVSRAFHDSRWETENKAPTFCGEVIVLTSARTFSAAMLFALYIQDNSLGKIVGETPGNLANGYGEIATFCLKNSGLYLSVSTKAFHRPGKDGNGTGDDYVTPDVVCDSDDALTYALELPFGIPEKSESTRP